MKHEDGNICCEGCYRIGLTTGRKLTAKELGEQLIIDTKHYNNAKEFEKVIKKRLEVEYDIRI